MGLALDHYKSEPEKKKTKMVSLVNCKQKEAACFLFSSLPFQRQRKIHDLGNWSQLLYQLGISWHCNLPLNYLDLLIITATQSTFDMYPLIKCFWSCVHIWPFSCFRCKIKFAAKSAACSQKSVLTLIENDHLGDLSPENDCCWWLTF